MKERFKIQITSGEARGWFVGAGLDPAAPAASEVPNDSINVPGSEYSLYVQEVSATEFFEGGAAKTQIELQILGYESVLVRAN